MTLLHRPRRRAGFTLIELLVVIAIIAILVALLMAAVQAVRGRSADAGAMADLSELKASLATFKGKYGVYPPSRFRLYPFASDYQNDIQGKYAWSNPALAQASMTLLNQMWPNLGAGPFIWDGVNVNPKPNQPPVDLDGDQCLVFFLGGIPTQVNGVFGTKGFANDSHNPTNTSPTVKWNQPFFNFPSGRLYTPARGSNKFYSANFPSFKDYYGYQPYVYLSAGNRPNGYDPNYGITLANTSNPKTTATVTAYFDVTSSPLTGVYKFIEPNTYQILCAGRNGDFNPFVAETKLQASTYKWNPSNVSNLAAQGQDDRASFYDGILSAPQ